VADHAAEHRRGQPGHGRCRIRASSVSDVPDRSGRIRSACSSSSATLRLERERGRAAKRFPPPLPVACLTVRDPHAGTIDPSARTLTSKSTCPTQPARFSAACSHQVTIAVGLAHKVLRVPSSAVITERAAFTWPPSTAREKFVLSRVTRPRQWSRDRTGRRPQWRRAGHSEPQRRCQRRDARASGEGTVKLKKTVINGLSLEDPGQQRRATESTPVRRHPFLETSSVCPFYHGLG